MKKLMILLMLMVALPSTAQNSDNPFPKKGYKVKWIKRTPNGFESYTCTIRKFEDSDTIYYMTYSPPDLQPNCVCFSLIHQKGAEMIADAMEHLNKRIFEIHPCLSGRSCQQVQRLLDLFQTQDTGENTDQELLLIRSPLRLQQRPGQRCKVG